MKKVSVILLTLFMALVPLGSVMADKGGAPNENAAWGQAVSDVAQEGGMGQYFKSGGEARTFLDEASGEEQNNGNGLANIKESLIDWFKSLFAEPEPEPEPEEQ